MTCNDLQSCAIIATSRGHRIQRDAPQPTVGTATDRGEAHPIGCKCYAGDDWTPFFFKVILPSYVFYCIIGQAAVEYVRIPMYSIFS